MTVQDLPPTDSNIAASGIIDTDATAAYISVTPKTLIHWRCTGSVDLPFIKVGRAVRYRVSDIEEWLTKNTRRVQGEV